MVRTRRSALQDRVPVDTFVKSVDNSYYGLGSMFNGRWWSGESAFLNQRRQQIPPSESISKGSRLRVVAYCKACPTRALDAPLALLTNKEQTSYAQRHRKGFDGASISIHILTRARNAPPSLPLGKILLVVYIPTPHLNHASPSTSNGLLSTPIPSAAGPTAAPPASLRLSVYTPGLSPCFATSTTLSALAIALACSTPSNFFATVPFLGASLSTSSLSHFTLTHRPTSLFVVSSTAPKWLDPPSLVIIPSRRSNSSRL